MVLLSQSHCVCLLYSSSELPISLQAAQSAQHTNSTGSRPKLCCSALGLQAVNAHVRPSVRNPKAPQSSSVCQAECHGLSWP